MWHNSAIEHSTTTHTCIIPQAEQRSQQQRPPAAHLRNSCMQPNATHPLSPILPRLRLRALQVCSRSQTLHLRRDWPLGTAPRLSPPGRCPGPLRLRQLLQHTLGTPCRSHSPAPPVCIPAMHEQLLWNRKAQPRCTWASPLCAVWKAALSTPCEAYSSLHSNRNILN